MDPIRRKLLKTGAAATAIAAAQRVFAQQTGPGGARTSFYEKGPVRIHYEEAGSGFPLLLIAGGGLNSTIAGLKRGDPFHAIDEFKGNTAASRRTCAMRMAANLRDRSKSTGRGTLYRRSSRCDGSPWHRQVHGDGLLHRRSLYLESAGAGA